MFFLRYFNHNIRPASFVCLFSQYVAPPEPKKMVNVEERFKKPEVEKAAPQVNKIVIPTFEKQTDSDEVR